MCKTEENVGIEVAAPIKEGLNRELGSVAVDSFGYLIILSVE
jgi:hypothetical protein